MAEAAVAEAHNDKSRSRAAAHRMLAVETGITAAIALLFHVFMGIVATRSAVLGGLTFIVPNALFVALAFRPAPADSAVAALRGLYAGEAAKLTTTAVMFAAGFMLVEPLHVGALFATYVTLLVANLAGNWYLTK